MANNFVASVYSHVLKITYVQTTVLGQNNWEITTQIISHALILALKPVEDHEWFLQVIPNTLQHSSDSTAVSKSCIKYCARSMCKSSWASAPNINAFNASVHHLWPMGQWGSMGLSSALGSYHPITPPDSTGLKDFESISNGTSAISSSRSLCMDCFCDGFGLTKTELGGSAFNGCLWLMYCWLAISVHFLCGLLFFPEHSTQLRSSSKA